MTHSTNNLLVRYFIDAFHLSSAACDADGGVTFMVDELYRVRVIPTADGWAGLRARVGSLPPAGGERDAWLTRLGNAAFAMMRDYSSSIVVDEREDGVYLQQMLRPDCRQNVALENLGVFVNALVKWRLIAEKGVRH